MSGDKPQWHVVFTHKAEEDLREIVSFLVDREGPDLADAILDKCVQARDSLGVFPERERVPPELARVHVFSYREIQVPPFRVIHQVHKASHTVFIHLVADSRRNFTELLKHRLLHGSYGKNPLP